MKRPIFIFILSTIYALAGAQEPVEAISVRVVFTVNYQRALLGYDPVWRNWPDGSLSRALTYIRAHRRESGADRFALVNAGEGLSDSFRLYSKSRLPELSGWAGFESDPFFHRNGLSFSVAHFDGTTVPEEIRQDADFRIGIFTDPDTKLETIARRSGFELAVAAFGHQPQLCRLVNAQGDTVTVVNTGDSGRYLALADFVSPGNFTARFVDVAGFPADAEYEEHFRPLADSLRSFYDAPIALLPETLSAEGFLFGPTSYVSLFHRFQLEATGAAISFFAPPLPDDSIPAGELTFGDIVRRFRRDNRLCVVRLTQAEVVEYLEYVYGLRYNTMRSSSDDLPRMARDRDGILRTRSAVYNLDEAGGIRYRVDVSRPAGRRIRILSFSDGSPVPAGEMIPVALHSHRIANGTLARACGLTPQQIAERIVWTSESDYRLLLRDWLIRNPFRMENDGHWHVVPEAFLDAARRRFESK